MSDGGIPSGSSAELALPIEPGASDAALWEKAQQLRPYLKAVVGGVLAGQINGKVDPSDIVQRAMVTALVSRNQFQGDKSNQWQAWLVTVARNEARKALRFWRQEKRDVGRERPLANRPGESSSPSSALFKREKAIRLLAAVERLSESDRTIIQYRNFQGLSHAEIAQRLHITEAAARRRWCDALRRLKERLGGSSG